MIQRIQTIWLFLASGTLFLLFVFPYLQFFDNMGIAKALKITGVYQLYDGQVVQTEPFILQTIATVMIALLPLVIIFNYGNRKKQIKLAYLVALLIVMLGSWLFMSARNAILLSKQDFTLTNIGIGSLLVPLSIVFLILAVQGIRKDEKLVKSADRLR